MKKFRIWDKVDCKFVDNNLSLNEVFQFGLVNGVSCFEVKQSHRYVVQFCTELYDINDKEIYEGDVVKSVYEGWEDSCGLLGIDELILVDKMQISFVEFNGRGFYVCEETTNYEDGDIWDDFPEIEIIGNIFQDMDLVNLTKKIVNH